MASFTVTVGNKDYDVDAPDEKTAWKWARSTHLKEIAKEGVAQPPPTPFKPSGETALSPGEEILANPYGRAAVGMAKPIIGLGQTALNLVGQGEGINREMQNLQQSTQKAREYVGSRGIDLADLAGQSAAFAIPATKVGNAATTFGRVGQGMLFGAGAGIAEPVNDPSNYWDKKTGQIAGGAIAGGLVPAAWELAKGVGRVGRGMVQPYIGRWGEKKAVGRIARDVAGDKADDIIRSLESPQSFTSADPTAGQAAMPAGSAEFSALQKVAQSRDPSKYFALEQAQNQARVSALRTVGKTPADIEAAEAARAASASPLREGTFEATRAVGVSTDRLMRQIRGVESQPGIRASDVVQKSLADIKEKIAKFTSEDGFINAKDLYTIRKEVGNTIKKYAQETQNWDKRLAGGLERDLQRNIDDAIEAAGGAGWKDYLSTYAQMSKPIEQMQVGQALEAKLEPALGVRQRATQYAEALRKMGTEGELGAMRPEQLETLRNVGKDLTRDLELRNLARVGMPATLEKIGAEVPKAVPTGFFDPRISVTRSWYNALSGGATNKILDALAKDMDKPQQMAEIMRNARPFERQAIVDALMRYQATIPAQMGNQ